LLWRTIFERVESIQSSLVGTDDGRTSNGSFVVVVVVWWWRSSAYQTATTAMRGEEQRNPFSAINDPRVHKHITLFGHSSIID